MKKITSLSAILRSAMALAVIAGTAFASQAAVKKDVGYADVQQDIVWGDDGYATTEAENMSFGVKLNAEMMKNYAGARVVGFRVGWSCEYNDGEIDLFLREDDFNNPDKVSKHAKVTYKPNWNEVLLDEPYTISDNPGDIMIGFHLTTRPKEICVPFSVLGLKPAGSAYMAYDNELDADGKMIWVDMSQQYDALLLLAIVEMDGNFSNRVEITNVYNAGLQIAGKVDTGKYEITNRGSNSVRSLTLNFTCGDKEENIDVNLSSPIAAGKKANIYLPIPGLATGETTVTITKVNGKENAYKSSKSFEVVAVPEEVAAQYERRSLLEYFGSESSHHNVNNFDVEIMGGYTPYKDRMSLVAHHMNDQFMLGGADDYDEATLMLIDYADGDMYKVWCPSVTIDRTLLPGNVILHDKNLAFSVPTATYAPTLHNAALAVPTFAGVGVANTFDADKQELTIDVNGSIADGVLPEGETLNLTVYVLEDNVASTAQDWTTPEQEELYGGVYHHQAMVRDHTGESMWGEALDGAGDFHRTYKMEIDTEVMNPENMRTVAVLHRSEKNVRTSRQVINCAEASLVASAIRDITVDTESAATVTVTPSRSVTVNGTAEGVRVYSATGALMPNRALPAGIYVIATDSVTAKVIIR